MSNDSISQVVSSVQPKGQFCIYVNDVRPTFEKNKGLGVTIDVSHILD